MTIQFSGEVWYWKGPAPWYFLTVPQSDSKEIKALEKLVTYGWGMIPATARIGNTTWSTALWPKDGHYILPLNVKVRRAEGLEEGASATAVIEIG
jgi:hypothetical protein